MQPGLVNAPGGRYGDRAVKGVPLSSCAVLRCQHHHSLPTPLWPPYSTSVKISKVDSGLSLVRVLSERF